MASIAGMVCEVGGDVEARCLREKRARKRAASGEDSDVKILRSVRMVESTADSGTGSTAEGAMVVVVWS